VVGMGICSLDRVRELIRREPGELKLVGRIEDVMRVACTLVEVVL